MLIDLGSTLCKFARIIDGFVVVLSPPDYGGGGGMFANSLPGGDVCQLWVKFQPKAGKRPFVCKIQYFVSKIHKNNYVCQLLWPQNVGKRPFLETLFFEFFSDISFGLPGPLRTAFELKNSTAYSKKSGACDCANG